MTSELSKGEDIADDAHPGLTITVYRVNSGTMARTSGYTRVLAPAERPPETLAYPPCECACCARKGTR
ncbi:hypothetical protein [Streptomyces apocyni]|uniref:hypothetical protein n=1 Tax=Streptomyces apocyni TaxID=2654677 RepID=UPI0012E9BE90|nr:hypothetical protein [Streptomyces apocyni]